MHTTTLVDNLHIYLEALIFQQCFRRRHELRKLLANESSGNKVIYRCTPSTALSSDVLRMEPSGGLGGLG